MQLRMLLQTWDMLRRDWSTARAGWRSDFRTTRKSMSLSQNSHTQQGEETRRWATKPSSLHITWTGTSCVIPGPPHRGEGKHPLTATLSHKPQGSQGAYCFPLTSGTMSTMTIPWGTNCKFSPFLQSSHTLLAHGSSSRCLSRSPHPSWAPTAVFQQKQGKRKTFLLNIHAFLTESQTQIMLINELRFSKRETMPKHMCIPFLSSADVYTLTIPADVFTS